MRIKCKSRELTEEQRELLNASSRFRPNHRITIGKEYLVLGLVGVIHSSRYGSTTLFEIFDDDRHLVLYPAVLFDVTDARCSSFWRAAIHEDGTVTLRPEELYQEFFHDDLSDGDPAVRKIFEAMVARLDAEFA